MTSEVGPTGTALIIVDGMGENAIMAISGANHLVAALSVQRQGAGPSMPTAEEIAAFLPG